MEIYVLHGGRPQPRPIRAVIIGLVIGVLMCAALMVLQLIRDSK